MTARARFVHNRRLALFVVGLLWLPVASGHVWAAGPGVAVRTVQYEACPDECPLPTCFPDFCETVPVVVPVCPEEPGVPIVVLRVRVAATATAGENLEYHLCVENRGQASAYHLTVRAAAPPTARFVRSVPEPTQKAPELSWQIGTLEPCGVREIVLVLAPTGGDVALCARVQYEHGECVTTRVARSAPAAETMPPAEPPLALPPPVNPPVTGPAPVPPKVDVPPLPPPPALKPGLSLRKRGPERATLYDPLTYQLVVENPGTGPTPAITLTDTLPPGLDHASGQATLTWNLPAIEAGQSRTVEYQVIAKAAGKLCNRAAAIAGELTAKAESCVVVTEPKLQLTMTGPAAQYINLPATYRLTVTNPGSGPTPNVVVRNQLPNGMQFLSASASGRIGPAEVSWQIGTLPPGESRSVEVTMRATGEAIIVNRATATADRGLTATAETKIDFRGVSALMTEIRKSDDPVEVGNSMNYLVTVRNDGTIPAEDIVILATVPAEMTITRVTGPADHVKDGNSVRYKEHALPAGAEARYQIFVRALRPGDVRFLLELTAKPLTAGPVRQAESTTIFRDPAGRGVEGTVQKRRLSRRVER